MKKLFVASLILLLVIGANVFSADTTDVGWNRSLVIDVTTTQTGYSDSWVGGEAGSFNWVGNINSSAQKQLSDKFNLKSTLKISFGQTKTQDAETKKWTNAIKSTDLIDFENVGKITLGGFVDPYVAFRVLTQFYDGQVESMKQYFSPMTITESAGITRLFYKKDKQFITSRLGLGIRQIFKSSVDTLTDQLNFTVLDTTQTDGGL